MSKWFLLSVVMFFAVFVNAEDGVYSYSDLMAKSYDDMEAGVKERVLDAQNIAEENADGARKGLKDALVYIFSRPNTDNVVGQLITPPRSALKNLDAYEDALSDIAEDAIEEFQRKKSPANRRATQIVILENLMTEVRPDAKANAKIKAIYEKIAKAKLTIPDDVVKDMRLKGMFKKPASPSEVAAKVLEEISPKPRR